MSQSASNTGTRFEQKKTHAAGKLYEGRRTAREVVVTVNGRALDLRLDLRNHSPTGFEWGYSGSGPAQLALAILAEHLGDGQRAQRSHQEYKYRVVAGLPREGWRLTSEDISKVLAEIEQAIHMQ